MPNYWISAVKQWNEEASHDGFLIPKAGTASHKKVRSIMENMKAKAKQATEDDMDVEDSDEETTNEV